MFWKVFILHKLSLIPVLCLTLSETEPTLQGLLQSSSNESVLQVIKTNPPVGLVLLVRNELKVDVLQKTICYIISFSSIFGEGLHQAAFSCGHCLQIPCSWARTLSFVLTSSKPFLWQELVEEKQNEQECLIIITKKEWRCRWRDSKSLQNHYVIGTDITDAVYLVLGSKAIHHGTKVWGRSSCTAEGSRMLKVDTSSSKGRLRILNHPC